MVDCSNPTAIQGTFGDWLSQRSDDFGTWPVIGDKKNHTGCISIFNQYSAGLQTNRDSWVYNHDQQILKHNVVTLLENYNHARVQLQHWLTNTGTKPSEKATTAFLKENPQLADEKIIKWSSSLYSFAARNIEGIQTRTILPSLYRPFSRQYLYYDRLLNHRQGQIPSLFPTPAHSNIGFVTTSPGDPSVTMPLATSALPDLHVLMTSQFFARFQWEPVEAAEGELDLGATNSSSGEDSIYGQAGEIVDGYRRIDNITDAIAKEYRTALGNDVSRDDIFHYVYGVLHDPNYRENYAADLKKMLPHIETPTDRARFNQVALVGKQLMDLHVDYENAEPYPLDVRG